LAITFARNMGDALAADSGGLARPDGAWLREELVLNRPRVWRYFPPHYILIEVD